MSRRRARHCSLQSFEFSRSIDAFWNHVAGGEARGWHPRWLHREQSVWTPFGTANGIHCALMNEDGMVEVDQGSFSIEPMLWIEGRLFTWADVELAAGTAGGLDAGAVRDLGDRGVAAARTGRGDAERRVASALRFENLTDRP